MKEVKRRWRSLGLVLVGAVITFTPSNLNSHDTRGTQGNGLEQEEFGEKKKLPFSFVFFFFFNPPGLSSPFSLPPCIISLLLYCNLPPHCFHSFLYYRLALAAVPPPPPHPQEDQTTDMMQCMWWVYPLHTTAITFGVALCWWVYTTSRMQMLIPTPQVHF